MSNDKKQNPVSTQRWLRGFYHLEKWWYMTTTKKNRCQEQNRN